MAFYKNTANQQFVVYGNDANGAPVPSGEAVNITAFISKDGADAVATDDTNPSPIVECSGFFKFSATQAETNADVIVVSPRLTGYNFSPSLIYTVNGSNVGLTIDAAARQAILYNSGLLTSLSGVLATESNVSRVRNYSEFNSGILVNISGLVSSSTDLTPLKIAVAFNSGVLDKINVATLYTSGLLTSLSGIVNTISVNSASGPQNTIALAYASGILNNMSGILSLAATETNVSRVRNYTEYSSGILTHLSGIMLSTSSLVYTNTNIEYVSGVVKLLPNVDTIMASGNEEGWNAGSSLTPAGIDAYLAAQHGTGNWATEQAVTELSGIINDVYDEVIYRIYSSTRTYSAVNYIASGDLTATVFSDFNKIEYINNANNLYDAMATSYGISSGNICVPIPSLARDFLIAYCYKNMSRDKIGTNNLDLTQDKYLVLYELYDKAANKLLPFINPELIQGSVDSINESAGETLMFRS